MSTSLHHQPDAGKNPEKRPEVHHARPYTLPWYQDTFVGLMINRVSKGKLLPFPEDRGDFVPPAQYMPGYKTEMSKRRRSNESSASSLSEQTALDPSSGAQSPKKANSNTDQTSTDANKKDSNEKKEEGSGDSLEKAPTDQEDDNDPYLVHWNGDNDPDNPQNWTQGRKAFVTFLLCLLTLSVYMGSAIYTPGIQSIMAYFNITQITATFGLTLFVFGYGLGPMVGLSSMSEIPAIGRTMPYLGTLFLFVVLQVPTALASNIAGFLVLRFLTGLIGSPPLATGGASIGDMYSPRKRPLAIGVWGLSAVCGPVLGPLIGGFAVQSYGAEGWRWTIWPLLMLSGFTLCLLFFTLPETSSANILHRRAMRLRKVTGNPHLLTKGDIFSANLSGKEIALMTFVRPFVLSFKEPIVLGINLSIGLVYGCLYLWLECLPIVFGQGYGFNLGEQGLAFMGIFIGAVLVYLPFFLWHKYSYEPLFDKQNGNVAPEKWLEPAIIGAWFIPICLFGFGWTANTAIPWIVPIIMSSFFSIGTFLIFQSGLAYLGDTYPDYVASVYAGNDFFRSMIGAFLPLGAHALYTNLQANGPKEFPVAWGCTLIGCISVVMAPIPFLLYKFGPKLRSISKYALSPKEDDSEKSEKNEN